DRPFTSFGTWDGSTVTPGGTAVSGSRSGAWVSFGSAPADQIGMKVGVSYVSVANAMQNLAAEDAGWDLGAVAAQAHNAWQAMLAPRQTGQMMQSLVNDAQQGGWLPKWPAASSYTGMMNGDAADPMLAEAYAFGARNFDTAGALAAMVKGATQVPTASQLGQG